MSASPLPLSDLLSLFAHHPGVSALRRCLETNTSLVRLEGLRGSAAPVIAATVAQSEERVFLFILEDEEAAGYFYNDLRQYCSSLRVTDVP